MPQSDTREFGDAYADTSVLIDVLGNNTQVRVLAVLIGEADRDLNATEISQQAGIGKSSFYNHIDDLLAYELVEQVRSVGNSPMYQINTESAAAAALAEFEWSLIEFIAEKEQAGELDEENRPVLAD